MTQDPRTQALLEAARLQVSIESRFAGEPLIHSHLTDSLEEAHPLAEEHVNCQSCGVLVHASNNECMQTWYQTFWGNFCTACFKPREVLDGRSVVNGGPTTGIVKCTPMLGVPGSSHLRCRLGHECYQGSHCASVGEHTEHAQRAKYAARVLEIYESNSPLWIEGQRFLALLTAMDEARR
jgi:hypothetical protein